MSNGGDADVGSIYERRDSAGLRCNDAVLARRCPVCVAFGVLARTSDFSVLETQLLSVLVFAGSAQLAFINLAHDRAGSITILLTVLLLNLRTCALRAVAQWIPAREDATAPISTCSRVGRRVVRDGNPRISRWSRECRISVRREFQSLCELHDRDFDRRAAWFTSSRSATTRSGY